MAFAERRHYERFSETVARHLSLPDLLPEKLQITAGQQEHPGTALLEFEPYKRQLRVGSFKCCLAVANLADEYSIVCQKSRGVSQNPVHAFEPVVTGGKTQGAFKMFGGMLRGKMTVSIDEWR